MLKCVCQNNRQLLTVLFLQVLFARGLFREVKNALSCPPANESVIKLLVLSLMAGLPKNVYYHVNIFCCLHSLLHSFLFMMKF